MSRNVNRKRGIRRPLRLALVPLFAVVLAGQARLTFESRVASNGDGEAVLTNRAGSAIVAYVFEVLREPCNPIEANRHIYAGYDSAYAPSGGAVQPSTSRTQNIGASHCNKDGAQSPARASLKAALFADGTSFGDSQWTAILLRNRKWRLRQIDIAIETLKNRKKNQTHQETVAALEEALASLPPPEDPRIDFPDSDTIQTAVRLLTASPSASLQNQIAGLLSALEATRARLQ